MEQYKLVNGTYVLLAPGQQTCSLGWNAVFNNGTWGVTGTGQPGCQGSVKQALENYFLSVPQDPLCSGTTCPSSQPDYSLNVPVGGAKATISAKLETDPNPTSVGCAAGYNYCVKSQQ